MGNKVDRVISPESSLKIAENINTKIDRLLSKQLGLKPVAQFTWACS
jgi:hypothetical protein